MDRILIYLFFICYLYNPSQVHNSHAIADVMYNTEVMRNKDISQIQFVFQFLYQIQHLRSYGDIQC